MLAVRPRMQCFRNPLCDQSLASAPPTMSTALHTKLAAQLDPICKDWKAQLALAVSGPEDDFFLSFGNEALTSEVRTRQPNRASAKAAPVPLPDREQQQGLHRSCYWHPRRRRQAAMGRTAVRHSARLRFERSSRKRAPYDRRCAVASLRTARVGARPCTDAFLTGWQAITQSWQQATPSRTSSQSSGISSPLLAFARPSSTITPCSHWRVMSLSASPACVSPSSSSSVSFFRSGCSRPRTMSSKTHRSYWRLPSIHMLRRERSI
jgi:hypothetical protein